MPRHIVIGDGIESGRPFVTHPNDVRFLGPHTQGGIETPIALPGRHGDWPTDEGMPPDSGVIMPPPPPPPPPCHHHDPYSDGIAYVLSWDASRAYQGTLSSQATLSAAEYKKGWHWLVTEPGTYAGNVCESGDMVYAINDRGDVYRNNDFTVIQANLGPTTNLSNIDIDQICV